jgi:O-methyltransferase
MTHPIVKLREAYLGLVHSTLVGTIYNDPPLASMGGTQFDPTLREYGWDWPSKALTMVGEKRLLNFRHMIESAIGANVPGDIVETGVWRGGACIMARAVLMVYEQSDRRVILCDSFEGLPPPDVAAYPADEGSSFHEYPELAVSLAQVEDNFRKFGLLDDQVVMIKGLFKDTMPTLPVERIAVLRLDGDMYESTIDPLNHLYDKVSENGWIIIDDYEVVPACKAAVHDFFEARNMSPHLYEIDGVGRFFQKIAIIPKSVAAPKKRANSSKQNITNPTASPKKKRVRSQKRKSV